MLFKKVVLLLVSLSILSNCESFLPGLLRSFDFQKYQGPVPTDPDVYRNVSELIQSKGYPVEEHFVVTGDYYILNIQRIRHGRKNASHESNGRPVVLLQHGLLADSACWVLNFPSNSLGFVLADQGFDVWLANSRGNRYSTRNKYLPPYYTKFWKWSFDAMAKYDIPATINYIVNYTGQAHLFYIGHSQGTLIGFTSFSTYPEVAGKVKLFIALAPIATIGNINVEVLRVLAKLVTAIDYVAPIIDSPFLPGTVWRKQFVEKGFCNGLTEERLCYTLFDYIFGDDSGNVNYSRIPVFFNNFPSGTSFRNMVHFAQLLVSGKCQMFDYGLIGNYIIYGQATPPQYQIENMKTPTALFSGSQDTLSDPKDVKLLEPRIRNLVYNKILQNWNHFDFIEAEDADKLLYPQIIELIRKYM